MQRLKLSQQGRLTVVGVATIVLISVGAGAWALWRGSGGASAGKNAMPEASAPPDPRSPAVARDYEAYWTAFLKASDPTNPMSSELAAHATGEELNRAKAALTARHRAGELVRGSYDHRTSVASVAGSTATVSDCLVARTAVYEKAKGRLKSKAPVQPQPLTVTMQLENGTWKVSLIAPAKTGATSCAS